MFFDAETLNMKITGSQLKSFINQPNPEVVSILLYGPDKGLVREHALTLGKHIVDDLKDPFRVVEIQGNDLKNNPTRLTDETKAIAPDGGRRLVRVKNVNDNITKIFSAHMEIAVQEDALVVIEGGELGPRSSLRRLFEKSKNGASVACYADNISNLPNVINEILSVHGLTPTKEAMAYLVNNLGSDRSITRSELNKLSIYLGKPGSIELRDVMAIINDNAAILLDDITMAVGCGNKTKLDIALSRTFAEGVHPIQVLRSAARHFLRLHEAAGLVANGKNPDTAMKSLKPPVVFFQMDNFRNQLRKWQPKKISNALDLLINAEIDCKTTNAPVEAICWRTLMRITQTAHN